MRIEIALLKADLIRKKAKMKQSRAGGDKKSAKNEGSLLAKSSKPPINVRKAISDEIGISERSLQNYMQIKEHGTTELVNHLQSGELKIGTAHRLLPKEIMKQLRQADKDYSFLQRVIEANSSSDLPQETQDKLSQLSGLLQELINKLEGDGSTHDIA